MGEKRKRRIFEITPDELMHFAAQKIAEDHELPPSNWSGTLEIKMTEEGPVVWLARLYAEEVPQEPEKPKLILN